MEAAACNLPVVTTSFGEMQQFIGREGFYELRSFEPKRLNALIRTAKQAGQGGRESVLDYDWDNAVQQLLSGRL
jgi:glycosyltransferase involved in cell wall biosynthesis